MGGGVPSEYCHHVRYGKIRIVGLPDGEKILKICLFVLTESMNVTDRRTDRQMDTARRHRPHLHSITWQKAESNSGMIAKILSLTSDKQVMSL